MKLTDLSSHDVFEFSYGSNYNIETFTTHWSEDSVFISDDDFLNLSKYIDKVLKNFNYMGPNKIDLEKWFEIKNAITNSNNMQSELIDFVIKIDNWLNLDLNKSNYFWILGI